MKKILHFIIEPIKFIGSRTFSNKVVAFFDRNKWLIYVIAFLVALGFVFFKYVYPELVR